MLRFIYSLFLSSLSFSAIAMPPKISLDNNSSAAEKKPPHQAIIIPKNLDISGISSFEKTSQNKALHSFSSHLGSSIPHQQNQTQDLISSNWLQSQEENEEKNEFPTTRSQTDINLNKEDLLQKQQISQPPLSVSTHQNPQMISLPTHQKKQHSNEPSQMQMQPQTIIERRSELRSSTDSESQAFSQFTKENAVSSTFSEVDQGSPLQKKSKIDIFWSWAKIPFWTLATVGAVYLGMHYISPLAEQYAYSAVKNILSSNVLRCQKAEHIDSVSGGMQILIEGNSLYRCFPL
jgi:hypothetical protein